MKLKLSLILITIMLLGTLAGIGAYAWFTVQIQSNGNTIRTGTLMLETDDITPECLFYVEPLYNGDDYYVRQWYPGLEVGDRSWSIKNIGTLEAKITGISAEVTYNPENTLQEARDEFADNLLITIRYNKWIIYSGYLSELLSSTVPLTKPDGTPIILAPDFSKDFIFSARLDEDTGNKAQGIDATITFIIHGAQVGAP